MNDLRSLVAEFVGAPLAVDVLIPHFGPAQLVRPAILAVLSQTLPPKEVVVVDDATPGGSLASLMEEFPAIQFVRRPQNGGFVETVADGMGVCTSPYVALLNNDAVPDVNWLETAVSHLLSPAASDVLGVTTLMVGRTGTIDVAGMGISPGRGPFPSHRGLPTGSAGPCRIVTGMCGGAVVVRRRPFLALGGFDRSFIAYHEDVDVSLRAALSGWKWLLCTEARVSHVGGATFAHGSDRHYQLTLVNELRVTVRYWPPGMRWRERLSLTLHLLRVAASISVKRRKARLYCSALRQVWMERRELTTERRRIRSNPEADGVLRRAWRRTW